MIENTANKQIDEVTLSSFTNFNIPRTRWMKEKSELFNLIDEPDMNLLVFVSTVELRRYWDSHVVQIVVCGNVIRAM